MNKRILMASVACALLAQCARGQTVLNNGGGTLKTPTLSLDFNFGEAFIGSGGNYILLTAGFLQPDGGSTVVAPPPPRSPGNDAGAGLDNAGESRTVGNLMLESTLGEFMTTTRTGGSFMLTQGILQPLQLNVSLPVLGLNLAARRLNKNQVQLNWETTQEFNNKGFYIERKKENEGSFNQLGFRSSTAANGNSYVKSSYEAIDTNNYSGRSFYRIRQEDKDGQATYSVVRMVLGDISRQVVMKAWPIPAPTEFNVLVTGTSRDELQIFDLLGRLVRSMPVLENQTVKITGLSKGNYFLKLKNQQELIQQVSVQ